MTNEERLEFVANKGKLIINGVDYTSVAKEMLYYSKRNLVACFIDAIIKNQLLEEENKRLKAKIEELEKSDSK